MATVVLSLPELEAAQNQKYLTVNQALERIDLLINVVVINRTITADPVSPSVGDRYIVASPATGDFTGQENRIAAYIGSDWVFFVPKEGWRCYDQTANQMIIFNGSTWDVIAITLANLSDGSVTLLGVNSTPTTTNRLIVESPAVLFDAETDDFSLKLNKVAAGDVTKISLQSGLSARAEIGLIDNNDVTLRVSSNGSTFQNALTVKEKSGRAIFKKIQNGPRPWNVVLRNYVNANAWLISTSAENLDWRTVRWSPELGLFCAVAFTASATNVMTSPDGVTWTSRTSASTNTWHDLCWSPELRIFAAVSFTGSGNRVMTSPDGITWTSRTSAADNQWRGICWSAELGIFVAVSDNGASQVMTSPDGINWTLRSAPANSWISVCWSPELGIFCACSFSGTSDRIMTSPDGITWTSRTTPNQSWWNLCWSSELNLFVVVSFGATSDGVMTSPDGINWTTRTAPALAWRSVAWSPELGIFAVVGSTGSGNRVMTSPDGITWTSRTSAADNQWYGVCWSPELGIFVASSTTGSGNRVMTSISSFTYPYRSS